MIIFGNIVMGVFDLKLPSWMNWSKAGSHDPKEEISATVTEKKKENNYSCIAQQNSKQHKADSISTPVTTYTSITTYKPADNKSFDKFISKYSKEITFAAGLITAVANGYAFAPLCGSHEPNTALLKPQPQKIEKQNQQNVKQDKSFNYRKNPELTMSTINEKSSEGSVDQIANTKKTVSSKTKNGLFGLGSKQYDESMQYNVADKNKYMDLLGKSAGLESVEL